MSEKFEQKKIGTAKEALEKRVHTDNPVAHSTNIEVESSQKEFKAYQKNRELFEGASYLDKKEYDQDLTEETLRIAEETIGKLLHKQEVEGYPIEKNRHLFEQLQNIVQRKELLENQLRELEENNEIGTSRYNAIKNQYEDALRSYNNLEHLAKTPDGNLIDQNEKVSELEDIIQEKGKAISPEDPNLN